VFLWEGLFHMSKVPLYAMFDAPNSAVWREDLQVASPLPSEEGLP